MSHTTALGKFTFIHNSDYSGDIKIINQITDQEMDVDSSDLFELFGQFLLREKCRQYENMMGRDYIKTLVSYCP